jgi:hypothetical protein
MRTSVALVVVLAGLQASVVSQQPSKQCAVTEPVLAEPSPVDSNADPLGFGPWYVNAERTIWTWAGPGQWVSKADGWKTPWVRPKGTTLQITGRRLDADAPPLRARIPCCYRGTFQATGIFIPTPGCWEVTATAGEHTLMFVTRVEPYVER